MQPRWDENKRDSDSVIERTAQRSTSSLCDAACRGEHGPAGAAEKVCGCASEGSAERRGVMT